MTALAYQTLRELIHADLQFHTACYTSLCEWMNFRRAREIGVEGYALAMIYASTAMAKLVI